MDALVRSGFRLLHWRWEHKLGEIDVVALDRGTLVFVEVKTRRYWPGYRPVEAVGCDKRKKLVLLGRAYLRRYLKRRSPRGVRFDVIGITVHTGGVAPRIEIEHIRGAFDEDGECL